MRLPIVPAWFPLRALALQGVMALCVLLFCLALAILAASFFNFTVVFTLVGVLTCMCLIKLACTVYYRKKY